MSRPAATHRAPSAVATLLLTLLASLTLIGSLPPSAAAHGPTAPVASDYLAVVDSVPAGVRARVLDGDQRMWLRVPAEFSLTVLDYRGAPYLRFTSAGVAVNHNSAMYYLNETPLAQTPPLDLRRTTPPSWFPVSGGHQYAWHDGRLSALATIALAPGTKYVGSWRIPLVLDGRAAVIAGGVRYAPAPSLVWYWLIVVILACILASWRVGRPLLDLTVARILAVSALIGLALGGCAHDLKGQPNISILQIAELVALLTFVIWGLVRVVRNRAGYFTYFVIALVSVWEGVTLYPTLRHGFVLLALPATLTRTVTVLCLGAGAGLMLLVFRLAERSRSAPAGDRLTSARGSGRRGRSVPG